jgi:hypothetical protein
MRRARKAAAAVGILVALAPLALAESVFAASGPPASIAPTRTAWFDATRASASVPAVNPPGVTATDLVVQGATVSTTQLPVAVPIPTLQEATAFTALSFRLPSGATPATLSLTLTGYGTAKISGELPGGAAPEACPITSAAFTSGGDQPISAAPAYDCASRMVIGQLSADSTAIEFPDIDRLVTGSTLSFVVLPGSLGVDRLVFSAPTSATLSLNYFGGYGATTSLPPLPALPPALASVEAGASTPAGQSAAGLPGGVSGGLSGAATAGAPADPVAAPSLAPVAAGSSERATPALAASFRPFDTARERWAAVATLALLIVGTGLLAAESRDRPRSPEWGFGRFRSSRVGMPPPL